MMMLCYILFSVLLGVAVLTSRNRWSARAAGAFYALQGAFALWTATAGYGSTSLEFFTFDTAGVLFFALMAVVSPVVWQAGRKYLDKELRRRFSAYNSLIIFLCISIACVYFSNNMAVTWIFLEATTLCTAGLIYHRRSERSLEATWKYVFVCSVGIAIAYLGVLLIGGVTSGESLNYATLVTSMAEGNPLFLKIAFLFILVGYSCKMELFPLYPIGVDANFATPAPVSALISTALVNAGFLAIFRVYELMQYTEVFEWVRNVLILAGVLSVTVGAMFMRRTNHYKRFLSYSTVENMGIVAIGLGIGSAGVYAALFHIVAHTLVKASMFLQIAAVGKSYGHYQINRTGDYMEADPRKGVVLLMTTLMLMAFPPSPLFVSELMILSQAAAEGRWWLFVVIILLLCLVIYNIGSHMLRLCFRPCRTAAQPVDFGRLYLFCIVALLVVTGIVGIWQPEWFGQTLTEITDITIQ